MHKFSFFSVVERMKSSTSHEDDSASKHSSALPSLYRRSHERPQHDDDGEIREAFQGMVSSDLITLTAQERSEALDDIHCVGVESQETTEMMDKLLAEFDRLVQQEHIYAAQTARQNKLYVDDPSFRMRFLRCNRYNVEQSVRQMMAFLQHKAAYFGEDKVTNEITLADLNEEEKDLLLSGVYHIQKENDRAGRLVVHVMTHMLGRWRIETLIHAAHYIANSAMITHPTSQLRGVVAVLYHDSAWAAALSSIPDSELIVTLMNVVISFPLRYSAMHICLKTGTQDIVSSNITAFNQAMHILPLYTRVRTRLHFGTDAVLQDNLRSHGLPSDSFPVELDANARKEILNEWIYRHEANAPDTAQRTTGYSSANSFFDSKRSSLKSVSGNERDSSPDIMNVFDEEEEIIQRDPFPSTTEAATNSNKRKVPGNPSPNDILLGRGWRVQNHEGNVRFRNFLEGHCDAYDSSQRTQKRQMIGSLVFLIKGQGVRFLKHAGNGEWVDSTDEDAENKVGQLFRTIRKNRQTQLEQQQRALS